MLHRIMPAGFQNIIKADDVALDVHIGIGDGIPDTCLGSQIDHHMEAVLRKAVIHQAAVCDAALDEGPGRGGMQGGFLLNLLQSPFLNGHIIIVVDIVKTHNLHAFQGF